MVSVDGEVRCVNIVTFQDHLEDFRIVDSSFFHEVDDFILLSDRMVHIMIDLDLNLILELTSLVEEFLLLWWMCEILIVLRQKVELADMCPRVESITHWVHCPDSNVFTTPKQIHLVYFLIK